MILLLELLFLFFITTVAVMSKRPRTRGSFPLVTSPEFQQICVRPGKLGISSNSKTSDRCEVWDYFGALYLEDDTLIDDNSHWCKLCVEKHRTTGRASKIQKYSLTTGTSTLRLHIRNTHKVTMVMNDSLFSLPYHFFPLALEF